MKVTKRNGKTVKCRVFSWFLVLTLLMTSVAPVGATSFEGENETLNSGDGNSETEYRQGMNWSMSLKRLTRMRWQSAIRCRSMTWKVHRNI